MAFPFFTLQAEAQQLDEATVANLARLPMHCISNEFPNKTNHLAETEGDAKLLPHELHPSFYGCLDWHSGRCFRQKIARITIDS